MVNRHFLTETELRTKVPAAFASSPEDGVSKRYSFIPTFKTIEMFKELGWYPTVAKMNRSNSTLDYGKHMIRFAKKENDIDVGDVIPEVVHYNSHDRSFANITEMGLYRLVCSNGLMAADSTLSSISQKHINITFEEIEKICREAVTQFEILGNKIEDYKTINLTEVEKGKFAVKAKEAYWGENSVIDPKLLLNTRRAEDEGDSLWNIFNILQENITKGGISYVAPSDETGKPRRRTTKETKNIVRDFQINKALWMIMVAFAVNRKF